jgi:hypothetical protein
MSDFSPEMDVQLNAVHFSQLTETVIEPFQVITGIPHITAFGRVEEQACWAILRRYYLPDESAVAFSKERTIDEKRITEFLRPDGFSGNLLNGYAVILPFDAQRTAMFNSTAQGRFERGELTNETPGYTVVYGGDLHSSRNAAMGSIALEEILFQGRSISRYAARRKSTDYLRRVIGSEDSIERASEAAEMSEAESVVNAIKNARFALRRLYSGGLPGSKRQS